ncbi:hypothetical protein ACF0H5_017237 [Mactra antiquata]
MSTQVYRNLPTVEIGGKKIRFLGHDVSNGLVHFPSTVNTCPGQLLFLGVDVLTGASNVLSQNYARIHTRYTKYGYTAKMELEGFKIEGIHSKQALWFYNIQGLFHVAFELGNLNFQRDCLVLLKDEWLKRYSDPLLQPLGTLKYDLYKCETLQEVYAITSVDDFVNTHEVQETTYKVIYMNTFEDQPMTKDDEDNVLTNKNCHVLTYVTTDQGDTLACQNIVEMNENIGLAVEGIAEISEITDAEEEQDNEMGDDVDDTTSANGFHFNTAKFMNELSAFLCKFKCDLFSSEGIKRLTLAMDYLYYLEQTKIASSDDVLFKLMEEFLTQVKPDLSDGISPTSTENNSFNIPNYKFILLYLISDWLGHEYQALESQIAEKVYKFKQENIMTIDLLPSSENLTDTLFPSFMKLFIENWCGFGESRKSASNETRHNAGPDSEIGADHCYSEPMRVVRDTNHPLVLLMLEFGSNSLISGIAHVVFSRLKAQNESELHACS